MSFLPDVLWRFLGTACCVALVGCAAEVPDAALNPNELMPDKAAPLTDSKDGSPSMYDDATVTIGQIGEDGDYSGPMFLHDDDPTANGWAREGAKYALPKFVYDRKQVKADRIEQDKDLSVPPISSDPDALFGIDQEDNGWSRSGKPR